jgi:hypothetical protein
MMLRKIHFFAVFFTLEDSRIGTIVVLVENGKESLLFISNGSFEG